MRHNEPNSTPHASSGNVAANQAGSSFAAMKPATSYGEQVALMESRGLAIGDRALAMRRLSDANYYRLRGYWLTFERDGRFLPGTTFEDIWDAYELDDELRLWAWRAIEPIEVKARTSLAHHLSRACGPAAHEDASLFRSARSHAHSMDNLRREVKRAIDGRVPCVIHNMEKYGRLPMWAAVEVMTMGTVSQLYGNLGTAAAYGDGTEVSRAVASDFGIRPYYIKSWLRHLTYVRNICGHHSRLYNRVMTTRAAMLKRDAALDGPKEFPTLVVLRRLYERSWPENWQALASSLAEMTGRHERTSLRPMGFPENWKDVLGAR